MSGQTIARTVNKQTAGYKRPAPRFLDGFPTVAQHGCPTTFCDVMSCFFHTFQQSSTRFGGHERFRFDEWTSCKSPTYGKLWTNRARSEAKSVDFLRLPKSTYFATCAVSPNRLMDLCKMSQDVQSSAAFGKRTLVAAASKVACLRVKNRLQAALFRL